MIDALDRELRARGVPARRRRRIRLELEDHLACNPSADLGDPVALARQFADELGTAYARRAGFGAFLALVPLGVSFMALFAFTAVYTTSAPSALTLELVIGVQLAFVGGMLALLRAWRLRRAVVVPAAEARVLHRRAALGLGGGVLTEIGLVLLASGYYPDVQWHEPALAWLTAAVGAASLFAGGCVLVRASRLTPVAEGVARDLSFDLGVDASPRHLAFAIAGAVALCIAVAGVVQADPFDGLVRAVGDGLLCLAGFAVLGRPLGLRKSALP
ncbi:MAG TPA: hypothetical protein VGH79_07850 [Gaiellaceae bacterium]|jgi:hypothetical protein